MSTARRDLTVPIFAALSTRLPDPSRDDELTRVAYTVHALAREIGATAGSTESTLRKLQRAGKVTVRHTSAGDVLYKLTDEQHIAWQSQSGAIHLPRKTRGERPKGGRKIRMTGAY